MTRILIVEDSATQAEQLRVILEAESLQVESAASAEEALTVAGQSRFDLVISDVVMPGQSGYELCRNIKQLATNKNVPVVLLTTLDDPMAIIEGLISGADNFLTKPYEPAELIERVRKLLENRALRSDGKVKLGVEVSFLGRRFTITSEKEQIVDLLISTFEDVVRANAELQVSRANLTIAKAELERRVEERTADLARTNELLHKTIQEMSTLIRSAPVGIFQTDARGDCQFVNEPWCRIAGLRPEEAMGRSWLYAVHPDDRKQADAAWHEAMEAGSEFRTELRFLSPAGAVRTVDVSAAALKGDAESAIGCIGCILDITERIMAEQAERNSEARLRASEQRYHQVVDLVQEAIWIHVDGSIVFANPSAATLFGAETPEVLHGRSIFALLHPDDRAAAIERTRAVVAEGRTVPIREMRLLGLDGRTRIAAIHAVPFMQGGRLHVMASGRDVTAEREAEAQLHQAQKMESVGQLTGGVAHDFNNLLTVIIGSLDSVLDRAREDMRPAIDSALKAAERGAVLIRQMLAFSRRQVLSPQNLDLNDLTRSLEDLLRRTLGDDIEIEMKLHPALWPATADKGQVENALLNLAINARDAMPDGGKLTIESDNIHLDEDYAARNAEVAPGDYVMLAVTDTGTGMPPEVIERAFEPFFTTKGVGKGTGLGLSMIYGFAKQSGGHLKIYSEIAHGTTVRLYLPRHGAEATITSVPKTAPADHPRGGETILVVEDDSLVRDLVVLQLRDLGYNVIEAVDGPHAHNLLDSGAQVDLLLTDVVMPGGMTGRQLAEAARRKRPALKTLYTSGYTENSIIHQGKLDPGVNFLSKPFRKRDLAIKIREVLDAV